MKIWRNLLILFSTCLVVASVTLAVTKWDLPLRKGTGGTIQDFAYITTLGDTGNLYQHQGKSVVLHFWATWCLPCLEELPALLDKAERTPDTIFLLVSVDRNPQTIDAFMASYKVSKNVISIIDSDMSIARALSVNMFPESFILDAQMRIRHHLAGAVSWKNYPLLN